MIYHWQRSLEFWLRSPEQRLEFGRDFIFPPLMRNHGTLRKIELQVSYVKRGIQQVSQEVDENCRRIGLEPVELKENENTNVISGCNNPGKIASAANNCAVASI